MICELQKEISMLEKNQKAPLFQAGLLLVMDNY